MITFTDQNTLTLLENGHDFFPALLGALHQAQTDIYLESYLFVLDSTGSQVAHALLAAAQRGVVVHVVLDGFGARDFPKRWQQAWQQAGIHCLFYRPELTPWRLRRHRLRRLHRKLCVVDQRIAFIGGINIIDDWNTPGQTPPRYDYAVAIHGPLVHDIVLTMRDLWQRAVLLQQRRWAWEWPPMRPSLPSGQQRAALVVRDNLRYRRAIEHSYLEAITQAHTEIFIANAYFFPGRSLRQALLAAAKRGVRVRIMVQGRVEYFLLHHACRRLYPLLLAEGIELIEYRRSFMHAKVAVIDHHWATVGSSNIDPFSLLLAREANLLVEDDRFAHQLERSLQRAIKRGGQRITTKNWQQRHWWQHVLSYLCYFAVRFLIGMTGYGRQEYS